MKIGEIAREKKSVLKFCGTAVNHSSSFLEKGMSSKAQGVDDRLHRSGHQSDRPGTGTASPHPAGSLYIPALTEAITRYFTRT